MHSKIRIFIPTSRNMRQILSSRKKTVINISGDNIRKTNKNINVYNDYEVDAVYIDSDIDLSKVFDS